MKRRTPIIVFMCIVPALLVVDMVGKFFTNGKDLTVIPKVIGFESIHNTGIAYNFFDNAGVWLIVLTAILTVAAVAVWWFIAKKDTFASISFAFFVAGAIGNLYDRIAYGYVRDFIRFLFIPSFPVLNIADICLTVGTIMIAIWIIFSSVKKKDKSDAA